MDDISTGMFIDNLVMYNFCEADLISDDIKKYNLCNIDMEKTGIRLKELMSDSGYDVKQLQELLELSCPQPIYRWFKGQILPSVNNLYMLSVIFGVHMEELLVIDSVDEEILKEDFKFYWTIRPMQFQG